MVELIASAALLGAVLVIIARVSVATDAQARLAEQRQIASLTLQNAMEELAVATPTERLARSQQPLPLDESTKLRLLDAELDLAISNETDDGAPNGQQATLRLKWTPTPDAPPTTLALAAWFYPLADPAEPGPTE